MGLVKIEVITDATRSTGPLKEIGSACDKVRSSVVDLAKSLAPLAIGSVVIAKLSSSIASAIPDTQKLASEIGRLQSITGMSAETASEYIAVFDQVGVSFGALEGSVTAIGRKLGGLKGIEDMVTDASGEMIDVFEKFGILIKNDDGSLKTFSDVFEQIRLKIQSASSETERMAIATQFFKGNAVELMPVLTMSASQWKEIADDAKKYGIILSQDNVNAVKQYTMAQRDMDDAVSGLKLTIGNELIPILKETIIEMTAGIASVRDFVAEHRSLLSLPWDMLKYISDNFTALAVAVAAVGISAFSSQIAMALVALRSLNITLALTVTQSRTLGIALAALAGIELAKIITNHDAEMTRLNKNIEVAREMSTGLSSDLKQFYTSLGIGGSTLDEQIKKFHDMVQTGELAQDATGKWINTIKKHKEETELSKKSAIEMTKALTEWKSKIEGLNPDLTEAGKGVVELTNDFIKLRTEFEAKGWDTKQIGEELLKGIGFLNAKQEKDEAVKAFETVKSAAIELFEEEKKEYESKINSATEYRDALVNTYNDAIERSKAYYNEAKRIDDMMTHGKAFLSGLHPQSMSPAEKMAKDREALQSLVSKAWLGDDADGVQSAMKGIEDFMNKYKGQRNSLGFASDLSGLEEEYSGLLGKLGRLKSEQEAAGNAWEAMANKQISAIQAVDEWVVYLQNEVISLDNLITQTKEFSIDTSAAVSKIEQLKGQILDTLNLMYNGVSDNRSGGNIMSNSGASYVEPTFSPDSQAWADWASAQQWPAYAKGTDYVPKTGLAVVHKGERITPADQNRAGVGNGQIIQLSIGDIIVQGVNKNGAQIGREAEAEIVDRIRRGSSSIPAALEAARNR